VLSRQPFAHLLIGLCMAGMVVSHFYAIENVQVAYMIAVKRMSLLFGIIYGALIFGEKDFPKKLLAGCVMVLGVFLIAG
jgi:drug/metabolite transporter (DMT)-like permease